MSEEREATLLTKGLEEEVYTGTPDGRIDILDMLMVVFGFSGQTYAESIDCPLPCP